MLRIVFTLVSILHVAVSGFWDVEKPKTEPAFEPIMDMNIHGVARWPRALFDDTTVSSLTLCYLI